MPMFKIGPPTPNPQALPLAPTVNSTPEISQRERVSPQRSFTPPMGDSRRFPPPQGIQQVGYPSTAVTPEPMTQPAVPRVSPIRPRKLR